MVVTDDQELAHKISTLSLHGLSRGAWRRFSQPGKRTYDIEEIGYKANFTDIQAAIGLSQLEDLGENYKRRQRVWQFYQDELSDLDLIFPSDVPSGSRHALHLFTVGLPSRLDRDDVVEQIANEDRVALGIHYKSIPDFQIYQEALGVKPQQFPISHSWGSACVSLSLSSGTSDLHVERVVAAMRRVMS